MSQDGNKSTSQYIVKTPSETDSDEVRSMQSFDGKAIVSRTEDSLISQTSRKTASHAAITITGSSMEKLSSTIATQQQQQQQQREEQIVQSQMKKMSSSTRSESLQSSSSIVGDQELLNSLANIGDIDSSAMAISATTQQLKAQSSTSIMKSEHRSVTKKTESKISSSTKISEYQSSVEQLE